MLVLTPTLIVPVEEIRSSSASVRAKFFEASSTPMVAAAVEGFKVTLVAPELMVPVRATSEAVTLTVPEETREPALS